MAVSVVVYLFQAIYEMVRSEKIDLSTDGLKILSAGPFIIIIVKR